MCNLTGHEDRPHAAAPRLPLGGKVVRPETVEVRRPLPARTQRWAHEEVVRTLIEAEIASRDAYNPGPPQNGGVPGHQDHRGVRPGHLKHILAPTWDYMTSLDGSARKRTWL